jgi:hypothetical protein
MLPRKEKPAWVTPVMMLVFGLALYGAYEVFQGDLADLPRDLQNSRAAAARSGESEDFAGRAKKAVLGVLKAPATAQFPEVPRVTRLDDHTVVVVVTVDSQNSFSALLRGHFRVTFRYVEPGGDRPGIWEAGGVEDCEH